MTTRVAMATIVASIATLLAVAPSVAEEEDATALLLTGFTAHKRPVESGEVDWATGELIAEGLGKAAQGRSARQMAKRGATVVAVRNAMAIALGIKIDAAGNFKDIQNGEVHLKGVVKGHKVVSTEWFPKKNPLECVVKVSVPLWGVEGVSSVVYAAQHRKALLRGGRRLVLSAEREDVSDVVLVIDARGLKVDPCLFPSVAADGGGLLYDVASMSKPGQAAPPVRYVETEMTYEQLQAWAQPVDTGVRTARAQRPVTVAWGSEGAMPVWGVSLMAPSAAATKPSSQPSTQPATQPARKPRRRRVVKAVRTSSKDQSKIVLTKEDADRLRNSAEGASLLRSGRVIIVVDAVAAGIQGRVEPAERSPRLARAAGR